jgi:thiol-disulfide isomerase/thioredoxin
VAPAHLRIDLDTSVARAEAHHDEACPEIGPICAVRAEPPQQHHTTLWLTEVRLLAEYGLTPNFALQGVMPLRIVDTRTRYTDLAGNPIQLDYENIHHRDETLVGVGDAQLLLHYASSVGAFHLGARVGINLPTGVVHKNPYALGDLGLPHEHLQLGTGTFDPILAVDLSYDFGSWSLAGFAYAHVPLYDGPTGYRAGARRQGGVVASSGLGLHGPLFRLGASVLHEAAERWDGVVPTEDGNQGRTDVYVGPGVTIPFAEDWSVSLDVRARVYGHAVNAQLDLPIVVEVSIGRLFHLESGRHDEADVTGADMVDVVDSGEAVPLEPVPGKWTVFDFWAPWCEACKTLEADLRRLAAADRDVAVRRVNIVDFDSPISAQELSGVSSLPYVRLVDPSGKVVWQGSATPPEAMEQIDGHRTGVSLPPSSPAIPPR